MRSILHVGIVALAGCSIIGVQVTGNEKPHCLPAAAPIIDAVAGAVGLGGGGVVAYTASSNHYYDSDSVRQAFLTEVALPALFIGGAYAFSALYGYRARGECRQN